MGLHILSPDSVAGRAIALLEKKGAMRTCALAEALGVDSKVVSASLWSHVKSGRLVACKIERPGSAYPAENEYRVSLGRPLSGVESDMAEKRARANGLVVSPGPVRRTPPAGKASVPIDTPRGMAPPAPAAPVPAPAPTPAPAPRQASRSVCETAQPPQSQPPARRARNPEPIPPKETPMAVETKPFRCALASDGGMFLFPPTGSPVELTPEDTRHLVAYLRKLDELANPDARPAGAPPANNLPSFLQPQVS